MPSALPATPTKPRLGPSGSRALAYVGAGLSAGLLYALLNWQTDAWAKSEIGRVFVAFHAFVDRGIPLLAGGLAGLAFHWLHLRGRLARTEALRSEELRARLRHVERDQAAWVVAAAALHELKNPLHTLGLLVDELDHALTAGDQGAAREEMARVRRQVERALVPLDGLRALTRPNHTAATTRRIDSIASAVVESLRPVAHERGVELRLRLLATQPLTTEVDGEYLRIILDNLLANALEGSGHGPAARTVEVSVDEDRRSGRIVVRVSDDGPGLPPSVVDDLFEPLRTEKSSGLGLGLPIARALARSLGGELARITVAGFATSFEVSLPRSPTTLAAPFEQAT
jgi:two-component system, NtrC family, C4-dicarboxylate transport sensor histidine kinase DctB